MNMPLFTFKKSLSQATVVLLIVILLLATLPAMSALADDPTPPPTVTEEPVQPPTDQPAVVTTSDTPIATDEVTPLPTATDEPVQSATDESAVVTETDVQTPVPTDDAAGAADVLPQLPADTSMTVLDQNNEPVPLASQAAVDTLAVPDPYFTVSGTLYQFSAADCDPGTSGNQPCASPLQAAIDYLSSMNATPDDGTIYVESGTYNENLKIDGAGWTSTPGNLTLAGLNGSSATTVNGDLEVTNLTNSFTLQGFTFSGTVYIEANGGVDVNDVVVKNSSAFVSLEIYSNNNVNLNDTNVSGNAAYGASVDTYGDVNVTNGTFSNNGKTGLYINSHYHHVTLDQVNANENGEYGVGTLDSDVGATNSTFNGNTKTGLIVYNSDGNNSLSAYRRQWEW